MYTTAPEVFFPPFTQNPSFLSGMAAKLIAMQLAELPAHTLPREKLIEKGMQGLSEAEMLALILRSGYRGVNAVELSQQILKKVPLSQLFQLSYPQLCRIKGIGHATACLLLAIRALSTEYAQAAQVPTVTQPSEVYSLTQHLVSKKQEYLVALYLNGRNQLITQETITIGTLNASLIHARELFAPAIAHRAAGLVIVHNHPSGQLTPSEEDIVTTEKLIDAGHLLDIPVVDHVIVSSQGYFSFKHHQLL